MKNKKTLTLLLLAAMLCSNLFACGSENTVETTDTETTSSTETSSAETGLKTIITPELKKELGLEGYEVDILLRNSTSIWSNHDLFIEESTGDVLDDAIYNKNLFLEETYGFTVSLHYSADDVCKELGASVAAQDSSYDLAFPRSSFAATYAQQGYLTDLNSLAYLDLDTPVWSKMFNDHLSLYGKSFFAAGDISINSFETVTGLYYNYDLAEKYQLADPFEMVTNGTWTFDRLNEMATAVAADLNGDGVRDIQNDQYGFASNQVGLTLYYGANEQIAVKESEDSIILKMGDDRSIDVYDKIVSIISDTDVFKAVADADVPTSFEAGRVLFAPRVIYHLASMRDVDLNFGILPLAKYDEMQKDYVTFTTAWCLSPVVVPITVENPDTMGFIVQAMAEASSDIVKPAYYDICLEGKYVRDEKSADSLDILFSNFILDAADLYAWSSLRGKVKTAMAEVDKNIMSMVASYKDAVEAGIAATLEAYAK